MSRTTTTNPTDTRQRNTKGRLAAHALEPYYDDLDEAASEVEQLRAELDAAMARRNALLVDARRAGASLPDLRDVTGLASTGAVWAAMRTSVDDPALLADDDDEEG